MTSAEIHPDLKSRAAANLSAAGIRNVTLQIRMTAGAALGLAIHLAFVTGHIDVIGLVVFGLFLGAEYHVTDRWGLFAEYKFNRRSVDVEIAGGSAETRLNTSHIAVGTSYRL